MTSPVMGDRDVPEAVDKGCKGSGLPACATDVVGMGGFSFVALTFSLWFSVTV